MIVRTVVLADAGPFAWIIVLLFLGPVHRIVDPLFLPKVSEAEDDARRETIRRKEAIFMAALLLLFTTASVTAAIVTS